MIHQSRVKPPIAKESKNRIRFKFGTLPQTKDNQFKIANHNLAFRRRIAKVNLNLVLPTMQM